MKKLSIFILCIAILAGCNTVVDEGVNTPITIDFADDNLDDALHFVDDTVSHTNYDVIFTTDTTVKDFKVLEMDETEKLEVGETLFCLYEFTPEMSFAVSTYINDATINRGISYVDQNGEEFIFSIVVSMKDSSISLKEIKE